MTAGLEFELLPSQNELAAAIKIAHTGRARGSLPNESEAGQEKIRRTLNVLSI